jgi:hypothetical protein
LGDGWESRHKQETREKRLVSSSFAKFEIDRLLAFAGPATFKKKIFLSFFWIPTKTSTHIKSISFW